MFRGRQVKEKGLSRWKVKEKGLSGWSSKSPCYGRPAGRLWSRQEAGRWKGVASDRKMHHDFRILWRIQREEAKVKLKAEGKVKHLFYLRILELTKLVRWLPMLKVYIHIMNRYFKLKDHIPGKLGWHFHAFQIFLGHLSKVNFQCSL